MAGFTGRGSRRHIDAWSDAVRRALDLPDADLPPQHLPTEGPPPPRVWAERDPVAAARLTRARAAVTASPPKHALPVENLLSPDVGAPAVLVAARARRRGRRPRRSGRTRCPAPGRST